MQKVQSSRPTKKLVGMSRQVIHAYCKMPDKRHTGIDFSTLLKTPRRGTREFLCVSKEIS